LNQQSCDIDLAAEAAVLQSIEHNSRQAQQQQCTVT